MKKSYDFKFKSRAVLEALRGELTVAEIAGKYQDHPNRVLQWKKKIVEGASDIFQSKAERKESKRIPGTISRMTFYEVCSWPAALKRGAKKTGTQVTGIVPVSNGLSASVFQYHGTSGTVGRSLLLT